jgi:hypothetical protein
MVKSFKVLRADRAANKDIKNGDIVFNSMMHDYGCSNDDTRYTGIEHISVTLKEDGSYPFFTIPIRDLQEIK